VAHLICGPYPCFLYQYKHKHREKVQEAYLYNAYYELLICNCSGTAHVNKRSNSFTCHPHVYPQVE